MGGSLLEGGNGEVDSDTGISTLLVRGEVVCPSSMITAIAQDVRPRGLERGGILLECFK
jgi:hypothetical protein